MKMKKNNLLILAVAALGFAACANDETTAVNEKLAESNEISFRALNSGMMRAADASFANGTSFKVTAFETGATTNTYFSNVEFTAVTGTTFTSGNKYYWPSTYNLDFYAWQPAAASDDYSSITVTPDDAAASQIDLVYGRTNNWGKQTGSGTHDGKNGVIINFRHAESKVLIKLYNSNSNIKVSVRDASICNVKNSGVFAFNDANTDTKDAALLTSSTWDVSAATSTSYTQTDESSSKFNVALLSAKQVGVDWILIPQTFTYATTYNDEDPNDAFTAPCIKVSLKIQNNATGGDAAYIVGAADTYVTAMWPLSAPASGWFPGKKYTYTVDLAGGGYFEKNETGSDMGLDPILDGAEIKFVTVTVDEWPAGDATGVYTGTPASTPVVP